MKMPLRFNQRELITIATNAGENFEKEGVLAMQESEGKLFYKAEKLTERLLRLKGNLLFYFKSKDQLSDVAGVIVLDYSEVHVDRGSQPFSFVVESDEQRFELTASSEEEMNSWLFKIKDVGYEKLTERLTTLRKEIIFLTGQDPLPDYQPLQNYNSDISKNTECIQNAPKMEICIACTGISAEKQKLALVVRVSTMALSENTWSRHSETEICEDTAEPIFLKTMILDSIFTSSTRLKLVLCDVNNRSTNQVSALGQALCCVQDIQQSPGLRLSLPLKLATCEDEIGKIVLQGLQITSSKSFTRRNNSLEFNMQSGRRDADCLTQFPRTYLGEIVEKSFRFPTRNGVDLKFQELMGESLISFNVPMQLLELFIKEEKKAVLELHRIGELNHKRENIRLQQQNIHFDLVRIYSESLSDLSSYQGRTFKKSSEKCEKELEFVATNLHLQRIRVLHTDEEEFCYDIVTFGSPAAHSLKFRHGGLKKLLSVSEDYSCRVAVSPSDSDIKVGYEKANQIKGILEDEQDLILELCEKIKRLEQISTDHFCDAVHLLSTKIAGLLNLMSSSFIQDAEMQLKSSRTLTSMEKTETGAENTSKNSSWCWTGNEFKLQEKNESKNDQDCGTRDELATFLSLFNCFVKPSKSSKPDNKCVHGILTSVERLSKCVKSFVRKFNVVMRTVLMREEGNLSINIRDIRYRRDIVFAQALAPVIAGFVVKISENLGNKLFLEQISTIGLLVHFESLITAHGEELGMLEDAIVGFNDLKKVRFNFILDNGSFSYPIIKGSRYQVTVSIPLHEPQFTQLPCDLQHGKLISVYPVVFNVGINEHATIAERFGDMSIQENLNARNLNDLFSYYDKFSQRYPYWVVSRSESCISLAMLMVHLQVVIRAKRSKNIDILRLSEEICWRMNGLRLTSCKSAKDRTAMAVTLEAAYILEREHGLRHDFFFKVLNMMRSQGTRLTNSFKNVGIPKYAFNRIQVMAYPGIYRAPEGTYGKNVQN